VSKTLYTAEAHVTGGRAQGHGRDFEIDSKVSLITAEDRGYGIAAELHVNLPSVEDAEAVEIVREAHRVCPYSNATRGNVEVVLTANGVPVE